MDRLLYLGIGLVALAGCAGKASCSIGAPILLGQDLFCVPSENARFERRSLLDQILRRGQAEPEQGSLIEFSRADYAAVAPGYEVEKDVRGKAMDRDLVLIVPVSGSTIERVLYRGEGERDFEDLGSVEGIGVIDSSNLLMEPNGIGLTGLLSAGVLGRCSVRIQTRPLPHIVTLGSGLLPVTRQRLVPGTARRRTSPNRWGLLSNSTLTIRI